LPFLGFAQARLHKAPTAMQLADVTPALILAFLDHLETERHNAIRSRNARLAALRAFLKFAAHRDVTALHGCRTQGPQLWVLTFKSLAGDLLGEK